MQGNAGMNKRCSDEQIIAFLKQAEAGTAIKAWCREHDFRDASFYSSASRAVRVEDVWPTRKDKA